MTERVKTGSDRNPPLDASTLERVVARDSQALELFFEYFFDRVYTYATHLLGNATLAEDLAQEAFVRMHTSIHQLDPKRDPRPWVFTVVTNMARDLWRSKTYKTQQRQVDVEEAWDLASDDPHVDPVANLERQEMASTIRRALAKLSPADREIILLREYENLKTSEICEALGIQNDAVRQRYSRAVKRLGKFYKELSNEPQDKP